MKTSLFIFSLIVLGFGSTACRDSYPVLAASKEKQVQSSSSRNAIDLNQATLKELEKLPGIGKEKANAILRYRSQKPFLKVEDLLNIQGIGPGLFAKMKPLIKVSPR